MKQLKIADIVFEITSDQPDGLINWPKSYDHFLTKERAQVTLEARYDGVPRLRFSKKELLFDSEMLWNFFYRDPLYHVVLRSPAAGPAPYRLATFTQNFNEGKVYSRSVTSKQIQGKRLSDPLEFPLAELLMINLLAQGKGLMLHACGLLHRGKGYLFAGNSTHGKTTMSKLWQANSLILNDDRIVVRRQKDQFFMHGTPWHGDNRRISSRKVALDAIFFLKHSHHNYLRPKRGMEAATMLLTRSFPTLWDEGKMRFILDFCSQLAGEVPCFELGFVPDGNVVDLIQSHAFGNKRIIGGNHGIRV